MRYRQQRVMDPHQYYSEPEFFPMFWPGCCLNNAKCRSLTHATSAVGVGNVRMTYHSSNRKILQMNAQGSHPSPFERNHLWIRIRLPQFHAYRCASQFYILNGLGLLGGECKTTIKTCSSSIFCSLDTNRPANHRTDLHFHWDRHCILARTREHEVKGRPKSGREKEETLNFLTG